MTDAIIRPTLIYIIRLWAEPDQGTWVWRASLQAVHKREATPLGFASLDEATTFLQAEITQMIPLDQT
jgi:hypothetical protein